MSSVLGYFLNFVAHWGIPSRVHSVTGGLIHRCPVRKWVSGCLGEFVVVFILPFAGVTVKPNQLLLWSFSKRKQEWLYYATVSLDLHSGQDTEIRYAIVANGIAEVTGSSPVEALIFFFRLLLSNCLNWKIYCDDQSCLHC